MYEYRVTSQRYTSSRLSLVDSDLLSDSAPETFKRLKSAHTAGTAVPAWFDPGDPQRSTLALGDVNVTSPDKFWAGAMLLATSVVCGGCCSRALYAMCCLWPDFGESGTERAQTSTS